MCRLFGRKAWSCSLQSLRALASTYGEVAYDWLLWRWCRPGVHVLSSEGVHGRKCSFARSDHILRAEEIDSVLLLSVICGLLFLILLPQCITYICVVIHLFCGADWYRIDNLQFFKRVDALRAGRRVKVHLLFHRGLQVLWSSWWTSSRQQPNRVSASIALTIGCSRIAGHEEAWLISRWRLLVLELWHVCQVLIWFNIADIQKSSFGRWLPKLGSSLKVAVGMSIVTLHFILQALNFLAQLFLLLVILSHFIQA